MSSPSAAHASGSTDVATPAIGEERSRESRAKQRGAVLARNLVFGDALSAAIASALAVLIVGFSHWDGLAFVAGTVLLWPAAAFSIGLYRGDQLSIWASAVPEVPRGFVAILLITWPLFGIAAATSIADPVFLTFLTVAGLAAFGSISRTVVRAGLHRNEALLQRTLILGSGMVAGQVVEKLANNSQFGLVPIGIVDDDVYNVGSPDLPWLGRFADLREIIEKQNAERVIIAFSRASHEELLECIRACREGGGAVEVGPPLF
jgi:FlaA1/EpsC-like NDP-sugar epimerase